MQLRRMTLAAITALSILPFAAPAFAHDGWGWREHQEWHEHAWRERQWQEHQWREQAWREHEWRERYYPPVAITPGYSVYAPPAYYR